MELNLLELEFLTRVGWRIVTRGEVLGEYYRSLVERMGGRFSIDEKAMGGREFVGEIAGQLMAGEIIPQPQLQSQHSPAQGETEPLPVTVGLQDDTQRAESEVSSESAIAGQQVQGGGG